MEDISRELEKEIAQSRPKPYKKSTDRRILIIDNFGRMKSGEYLRVLVRLLGVASIVCVSAAVLFYYLYSNLSGQTVKMKFDLAQARQKVTDLTQEKEVLMAKIVMLGKDPSIFPASAKKEPAKGDALVANSTGTNDSGLKEVIPKKENTGQEDGEKTFISQQPESISPELNITGTLSDQSEGQDTIRVENKMVSIEKFTVTKDGDNGDLLVRFDIRNISKEPGDVSGRIFTVLKPEKGSQGQWLVVPSSNLNGGVPAQYRKGQYFSIAHFKPVKFRIKNTAGPDFFKTASIYIFNSKGELIFEKLIPITDESQAG